MFINFSDLPGFQNLFLDYIYEFNNVSKYYLKNFRNKNDFKSHFNEVANSNRDIKKRTVEIIEEQYAGLKPSTQTRKNINALKSDNTIAVLTGQQLGILGGPLYTIYKALTAIKLCSELKSENEEYNFVPVFWLAGDDHDFEEVSFINIINDNNDVVKIEYSDGEEPDKNRGPVGSLEFGEGIQKVFEEIKANLRDTDFTDELMSLIEHYVFDSETFANAFRKLMFKLFNEYGLIIFDAQQKEVKQELTDIFLKEINNYSKHTNTLIKTSAELEEIYHAQVKVKPVNLFLFHNGGRYSIEPEEDKFIVKGTKLELSFEDLKQIIVEEPERISPNVLMRPICQDYLFPTGFYVGGPGELNYFAQLMPLYAHFDIPSPIVYPRASITIAEKSISKVIERYNLSYLDFFNEERYVNSKVIENISELDLNTEFNEIKNGIDIIISGLDNKLSDIDKNLLQVKEKTLERIVQAVDTLKQKAEKAQERKHDDVMRQLSKVRTAILPNGKLQERELNFVFLVNKYGIELIKLLYNEMNIGKFEHQVIEL